MGFGMKDSIGLEIGSAGVRAARVSLSRQPELLAFHHAPLPPGVVREGEIVDQAAVARAISEAVRHVGKSKKVTVAIANQKVVARVAELPYIPEKDLRGAIRYQVQDLIPIPLESAVLDFQVLGEFSNDDQDRMMRVLVVAAHSDMVDSYLDTVGRAGLSPDAIDFTPLALMRSLGSAAGHDGEAEALMDVGTELTSMVVRQNGTPKLARVLSVGGSEAPETLVDEIRGSIKFYTGQSEEGGISRAVLAGEADNLETVAPLLSDALHLPVEVGGALGNVKTPRRIAHKIQAQKQEPLTAAAVGAALGAVES